MTSTAPPIRRLLPSTIERIAAGEVVERPASVVKELLENAYDASAQTITIRLLGGGLRRIEVADDGYGIPSRFLELALERHATSKLAPDGPIEEIPTLGFRGEALAAIAAVARLRLLSRPPGQEVAEAVSVSGGAPGGRSAEPRAPGTTVVVEDLFFNTPARRKFLRAPPAEQLEVVRTVERQYLARPRVAVRLESEGREIGVYPATADLRDAASRVLGPEFLTASFLVDGPVPGGRVRGYLGRPSLSASTGASLYLSANGRTIASRPLAGAVRAAYADALPRARFPRGVLQLELDLARVDVNVHPTKREVRFEHEREMAEAVRQTVRATLVAEPEIARAPLGVRDRAGPKEAPSRTGFPSGHRRSVAAGPGRVVPLVVEAPALTIGEGPGRPPLDLFGSLDRMYWVAATPKGLVLLDQHALSERLLYDALRRTGSLGRQGLVDPVVLSLTAAQATTLSAHFGTVHRAGFETEPFGPSTVRVVAVPAYRGRLARAESLRELLDELAAGGRPTVPDGLEERTAASIACHAAIRAGDVVERGEIGRLLAALESPPGTLRTCPHGRPILVAIDRPRIDRWFLRSER